MTAELAERLRVVRLEYHRLHSDSGSMQAPAASVARSLYLLDEMRVILTELGRHVPETRADALRAQEAALQYAGELPPEVHACFERVRDFLAEPSEH